MASENELNQPRQGGRTVNFHDADEGERGTAHGPYLSRCSWERKRGIVCESLREGRSAPVLKLKVKLKVS